MITDVFTRCTAHTRTIGCTARAGSLSNIFATKRTAYTFLIATSTTGCPASATAQSATAYATITTTFTTATSATRRSTPRVTPAAARRSAATAATTTTATAA